MTNTKLLLLILLTVLGHLGVTLILSRPAFVELHEAPDQVRVDSRDEGLAESIGRMENEINRIVQELRSAKAGENVPDTAPGERVTYTQSDTQLHQLQYCVLALRRIEGLLEQQKNTASMDLATMQTSYGPHPNWKKLKECRQTAESATPILGAQGKFFLSALRVTKPEDVLRVLRAPTGIQNLGEGRTKWIYAGMNGQSYWLVFRLGSVVEADWNNKKKPR